MKKIITALTVTALAISSVFAQASVEYTQKAFLYSPNGNKMELAGYDGNDGNIKFTVKNSNVGGWLTIKAQMGTAEKYDGSGTYGEQYDNSVKNDHGPELSEYVGWVKFGDGLFKLQSGTFDQRGANRFTGLAGKWAGTVYERYKLGVANGTIGTDIDNISIGYCDYDAEKDKYSIGKVLTSFIEYSGEVATIRAAINHNKYGYGTLDLKAGFSFQAIANVGEGTKLVADLKTITNNMVGFGLFAENTSLKENLDFLVGFTFAQTKQDTNKLSAKKTQNIEAAVDIRAKYKLGDNLGITTMNNLSYIGTSTTPTFNIWDMVSLDMPVSDKITAFFTVEWEYKDLFHEKANDGYYGELDFIPSVKYTPAKGVDLTAGLIMATYGWSRPNTAKFSVPLLLHVSL